MNALRKLARAQRNKKRLEGLALLQKLPKPPSDTGVCACGCCHRGTNDHGPCPRFVAGGNGRCAICDHGLTCHRRKGEPPPRDWNVPVKLNEKHRSLYPARVNAEIDGTFVCVLCGKPFRQLAAFSALVDGMGTVKDLCEPCFN